MLRLRSTVALAAAISLAASPALAHLDPAEHGSLMSGLSHPIFGLDHVLAMVAVGLWAVMQGGRATWAVPSAFVGTMIAGFGLAMLGAPLPFVEPAILASVVAIGLLVALAVRLPAAAGAAIVALFALFHGYAHGGEMGSATALAYLSGFAIATALLHGVGIAVGLPLARGARVVALRSAGAATALAGVALAAGVI